MDRVLVAGGAGFVGAHACKALTRAGFEPVVLDDLSTGRRRAVRWGPLVSASLLDRMALDHAFDTYRPVAVMHFAAAIDVAQSVRDPARYYRDNLVATLSLLDAMRDAGCDRLVFSSTAATYGDPIRLPIDEAHPQRPVNPYGETKLAAERALNWYGKAYGMTWVALRYFNAAGADPDGEIGESHDPETHLIPLVFDAILGRRPPLKVFGTDYPTPDGTAVRDYVHVTDLAEAHVAALKHLLDGGDSLAANLGTGRGHSIREVIAAAEAVTGRPVPHETAPRRAGDPPSLVADPAVAKAALGWEPRLSDLPTILRTAWQWHGGRT